MTLISRYIFRQTASALVLILISLTLIVWLTTILRELKLLTSQGQGFLIFLQITSLAIPNLLVTVAPIAFLIATLHTLNRLNGDSEIIVLSAAGGSVWRILAPYMVCATAVAVFVFLANAFLLPRTSKMLADYVTQVRTDLVSQAVQPGQFTNLDRGLTFHIRDKTRDGVLLGIMVHDERHEKVKTTILAEHGQIVKQDGRAIMVMQNGQIHRQRENETDIQMVVFDSYLFDIGDLSPAAGPREPKPREMSMSELLFAGADSPNYRKMKGKLRVELHERLSAPLYALVFALIAVVHLGRPRTTREGRAGMLVGAFLVCVAIRAVGIAGSNILGKKLWALSLVYGVPLAAAIAALLMLRYNIYPPQINLPVLRLPRWLVNLSGLRRMAKGAGT
jgi:lipopolysaccharide export system permease protein